MTTKPTRTILEMAKQDTFGSWWFLNGGMIHRDWKYKRYSAIRDLAQELPRKAWDARSAELQTIIEAQEARIQALRAALVDVCNADMRHESPTWDRANEAVAADDTAEREILKGCAE